MKQLSLIITIFLTALYCCSNKHASNKPQSNNPDTAYTIDSDSNEWHSAIGKHGVGLTFDQDSGYINNKDGLTFLESISLTDSKVSFEDNARINDTIGKYYKVKATGNYFVCLIDFTRKYDFETHLLLEIKNDGTVIKCERYFHGNYSCCWNNYYEGFFKTGNYFAMTTCGTGSGFCSSHIFFFKEIMPQENINSILASYWISGEEGMLSQSLISTIEWKDDELTMHYKHEEGVFDENYTKFIVKSTKKIDVHYVLNKDQWTTTDSTAKDLILF